MAEQVLMTAEGLAQLKEELEERKTVKRKEIKELIKHLKKDNKDIDYNIFKSLDNVNLNCALGFSKDGQKYSFLDDYDS